MNRNYIISALVAAAVAVILVAAAAGWMADSRADKGAKPPASSAAAQPAAQPAATPAPQPASFGSAVTARWTETTWESATAEAHKKVLESGKVATVTGEVVDVSCYLQLGKRGEAHVPCGTKCIQNGQPIGLVDAGGKLYLLMAEEHHPRRDGQVELRSAFLPQLAKTVTVTGMMTEVGGHRALFVQAMEVGGKQKMPAEETMQKKSGGEE